MCRLSDEPRAAQGFSSPPALTVGGKEIKQEADSALFALPVCGLHPRRGVCAALMSPCCSAGMLKASYTLSCNNTTVVWSAL